MEVDKMTTDEEVEEHLHKSGDGFLIAVADLNRIFASPINKLTDGYRKRALKGERAPTPGEFLLGYMVLTLALYEEMHMRLSGEDNMDSVREAVKELIDLGPKKALGSAIRSGGVGNLFMKGKKP